MPRVDWFITELSVRGGAESFVVRTAPYLSRSGWQIRVITLQKGGNYIHQLEQEGIPCIELGLNMPFGVSALSRLNRLWSNSPPDILHTHLYHAGIIGRIVAKKTKIPIVLVHQHGLERNRSFLRSWLDRSSSSWVMQYIVSCAAVSKQLQTRECIPESKINIIYNGVSIQDKVVEPDNFQGHTDLPPGNSSLIFGSVGRLEPEKGHEDLLYGFARINRNDTNQYRLWLIGDGSLKERLTQIAKDLGITQQVQFFGAQDSVAPYFSKMDLFVLPSRWEGISLALLEAMSHGIPIIATDVGGTPEVITNLYNGLLIPPQDPHAIANAIELLINDPRLRKDIGLQGKSHVSANFTLEKSVQAIDELYKRLLLV
jgi:glycosyltransferase involved in cell wall biosynthesis